MEPTGESRAERRLAAILAADVVGYSRLMGIDEEGTLNQLKAHRRTLIDLKIKDHRGRIVKTTGDGMLVEFASVVDAVRCATEIQSGMAERNTDVPRERRIEFRIGINVGDIIIDGDDIFGDGVNIAARLETLAEPGEIWVSRGVREQVRDKLSFTFEDMGEREVKNIARPVRAYRIGNKGVARPPAAAVAAPAPAADESASIVVLPFTNMSGDPEQEYFSDGISEDIITDLSKIPGLLVIARNSSFTFKGKSVNITDICKQFRVKCALEGSVRKAGQRVRITAQLIDGTNGGHLWAERYDRQLTDIFEVQDEVTRQIVAALQIKLSKVDQAKPTGPGTRSVEAHDYYLRGRECFRATKMQKDGIREAAGWFRRAIDVDPSYAASYGGLALTQLLEFQNPWGADPDEALKNARQLVDEALSRDQNDPYIRFVSGVTAVFEKDFERCRRETDKALALNPNYAEALNLRGTFHFSDGEPLKAVPFIEQAMRADPANRQQYLHFLGIAYLLDHQYEQAVALFRERIALNPSTDLSRGFLAAALGHLGEFEQAGEVWRELKGINPHYSAAKHMSRMNFRPQDVETLLDGLRKADLPAD